MGIRLGLADDDEDEDFEHSFDYSRLSKGENTAQSSLKDTVSVQGAHPAQQVGTQRADGFVDSLKLYLHCEGTSVRREDM